MVEEDVGIAVSRPTMEVRLNGFALDIGKVSPQWSGTLRRTARAMAAVAVERALEFGESHNVTIEVWDDDGRLLVTVVADIEATWPGSAM